MSRNSFILLFASVALVGLYVLTSEPGYPLDDSWIHQVYGRNLGEHGEWAFVPGIPSAASTSPLYTVLLAVGYALRIPYRLWTALIGVAALWAAGELTARLAVQALNGRREVGLFAGLAVIGTWQMIWAASSGMETPVFAALTLSVIFCAWRELLSRNYIISSVATRAAVGRGVVFGVVGALCTLARPEGVMLVGLAGLGVLVYLFIPSPNHWALPWLAGAAVGFGVTIAPYLLLNLSITGGLLPNTASAKIAQHAPLLALPYTVRFFDLFEKLLIGGQFLLLPGVVMYVVYLFRNQERRTLLLYMLPFLWVIGLVALYAARLPASYQHGRYVMPALPALLLMSVVGMALLVQRSRKSMIGRVLVRSLTVSAALLFAFFALMLGRTTFARDVQIINQEHVASARWIEENVSRDDLLAIYDIGAVGYLSPRPMLDIAGLLSPEVVPIVTDPEALWRLMEREGADYLMAFPDQVPGRNVDDSRLCVAYTTGGTAARAAGGGNMTVYRLAWNGEC
jgi:hypothetical protein